MCRVSPSLERVSVEPVLATRVWPWVGGWRAVTLIEESMNHVVTEELTDLFMGVDTGHVMLVKIDAI